MTSGLGNLYDVAGYDIPTLFLPPSNDSQALQLELLKQKNTVDAAIDWADIFEGQPIDYSASQQEISKQVTYALNRLKTDPDARKRFEERCAAAVEQLATTEHSITSRLVEQFGSGGVEQVGEAVAGFASRYEVKRHDPGSAPIPASQKTTESFALAGGVGAMFTSTLPLTLTPAQRLHMKAHLPGIKPLPEPLQTVDVRLEHIESPDTSLYQQGGLVRLHDTWDGKLSLIFRISFTARRARRGWIRICIRCMPDAWQR